MAQGIYALSGLYKLRMITVAILGPSYILGGKLVVHSTSRPESEGIVFCE